MNCDDCRQRMQACLDGEPPGGDGVEEHVAACPACRALNAAARCLRIGLLAAPALTPPTGLAERIVAGVLADRRGRQRSRRRLILGSIGLAAAASLVVAFLLPARGPNPVAPRPPDRETVAVEPVPPKPGPDSPAPRPSLNDNVAEATSAVASLARRTADQTLTSGQIFFPDVPLEMPPEPGLAAPLEPPAQSLREAGNGVANGLGPVADSARRAFDLFLRDMPPVTPESKSGL